MMTDTRSILALPAAAGARLLSLSWIDQVALRAEAWRRRDEAGADAASVAVRDALSRLRACTRNFRSALGDSVERADRRRARRLFALADRAVTTRRELLWLRTRVPELPDRERASGLWLADRLAKRSALADEFLTRGLDRNAPRLERRLARRLRTYTAEIYLGDAATDSPFSSMVAEALRTGTQSLAAGLGGLERHDGAGPLQDVERAVERVECCLEPLQVLLSQSTVLLHVLGTLRVAADHLCVLDRVATRILRALERESAARARAVGLRVLRGEATFGSLRAVLRDDRRQALLLLAARSGVDAREREADVRRDWLGGHPADVFAKLYAVADQLDPASLPRVESRATPA